MKKTKSLNNLMINTSNSEREGKFKNIMNSPNFGKQQIILQSCCFFDYEKCQTPKAQSPHLTFSNQNKNRINSSRISERNKNIFSKNKSNMDLIKSKFDEMRKNEVDKLKNENKVLKDTINNLILQLDKTFRIAENVKHKEKNIFQKNIYNENEIINMKNKINALIYEKQQLLNQIKQQEINISNNRRYSWSTLQSPKFGIKRNISFSDVGYNKIKNKNICYTEINQNNNIEKKVKCIEMINHINEKDNNQIKENIINDNQNKESTILYDKRLNKRKYIFNKKKANVENPFVKSRNIMNRNESYNNYNSLSEKFKKIIKGKEELKINFNGLLDECDNSRIKYNTDELDFNNDNSFIKINSNKNCNYTQLNQEKKLKSLEKDNYVLKLKLNNIENKEKIKYDLLMKKYNKLYSESISIKDEYNKKMKNKDNLIEEINNKYNNILKECNNKYSILNNLKAKYDQLSRINNNNISMMNNNRIKMNEIILENTEIKNDLRKKADEITQKNIEIGRFKKLVNDLNELKKMEKKLKENISKNEKKVDSDEIKDIKSKDININLILKDIDEYKSQIDKLNKEKEELQKENENLKENKKKSYLNLNSKNQTLIEEYKNKINKLEEKNKKMEKALTKANQELDQYEIESKEADIEIKSFKMKINELMDEIKKLKHKETIEEVIEENYEEEEDKKQNN